MGERDNWFRDGDQVCLTCFMSRCLPRSQACPLVKYRKKKAREAKTKQQTASERHVARKLELAGVPTKPEQFVQLTRRADAIEAYHEAIDIQHRQHRQQGGAGCLAMNDEP